METLLKERLKGYINICCNLFKTNNSRLGLFYLGKAEATYDMLLIETGGECESWKELFESLKNEEYKDITCENVYRFMF